MAKRKGGKSKGNVSAGVHSNVSKSLRKEMRNDYMNSGDRIVNQMKALRQGKRVMVTISNPNKSETNKKCYPISIVDHKRSSFFIIRLL